MTPQTGDTLKFGYLSDSHDSMVNDMTNLEVNELAFIGYNYTIGGNSLLVEGGLYNTDPNYFSSETITINCPLVFFGGGEIVTGGPDGELTQTTVNFRINGPVEVDNGTLDLIATANATSGVGGNGNIYISGVISGVGSVFVSAQEVSGNYSTVEFNGSANNTFSGILGLQTSGAAQINFNMSSGTVTTNLVVVTGGVAASVNMSGPNQLGNHTTVMVTGGSQLNLSGNNVTVGSIIMTNYSADALPSILDTGGILVGLNDGLRTDSENTSVHPIIKGKINFNGPLLVEVDGYSNPGLEIPAVIEGAGFEKTGSAALQLDGNNTFAGNLEISAGSVIPANAAALSPLASTGVILNGGNLQLTNLAINTDPLIVDSSNSTLVTYDTCSWSGPVTLNQTLNVLPQDAALSGTATTITGPISGGGGLTMLDSASYNGTLVLSGSSANTFTGPLTVYGRLLELDKSSGARAYAGPLITGGGSAAVSEARWLNSLQNIDATVTVYANGLVNLNNFNEDFGSLTFNGGEVESGTGTLELDGPVTANPATVSAVMYGNVNLPGGYTDFLIVGGVGLSSSGAVDLSIYATLLGPGNLQKDGDGILGLYGNNTYTGLTLLDDGITIANTPTALGTTASGTLVESGATLWLQSAASTVNESISLSGGGFGGTNGALRATGNVTLVNPFPGIYPALNLTTGSSILVDSGGVLNVNGMLTGTGPLTSIGPGELELTGSEANTYSGTTFVNQGSLIITKPNNTVAIPGNLVVGTRTSPFGNSGTTATAQGVTGSIGGTNLTVNGGSVYTLNNGIQFLTSVNLVNGGSIQTGLGSLELTAGYGANVVNVGPGQSGASVIAGNVYLVNGGNFAVAGRSTGGSTPELDLQAGLNDQIASGISKSGGGQLRLSAVNAFSSPLTINGGTLTLANSGSLGNSTSTTVNSNSTLVVENGIAVQNNSLTLNSSAQPALQSLTGSNVWSTGVLLNQTAAIQVLPSGGYLNLRGTVSGLGGLTTIGAGTLQFQGTNANTYSGLTTVAAGILEAGRSNTIAHRNFMGQLVTNEVPVTSIPGDTIIGSDTVGSPTAVLRSLREQQFPSGLGANVAVHLSGLLDLAYQPGQPDAPKEYVQTLTGVGQVNIGTNCSLTTYNTTPFVFSGTMNGAGALILDGPGTVTTWGNINNTGPVNLFNGDWELFGARHNGGITVNSGRLAGDGTVDGAVVVYGSVGVDSHLSNPQAGVFHLGSLSMSSGDTVQLSMYGPLAAGGNDQIATTSGGVSLDPSGNTILSTSFSYPPRAGDVIDLISVASGQTIAGTFTNFPEGILTLVGQTPVLPSYHGGAGHDFTLTVTNLALAYVGYQLAEGNGNQTVEPDECNLLYVSLVNRRANPVTITNACLRATTALGVVFTVPVAIYPTIPAGQTATNTTPFQFKTDINLPCGGAVAFELVLGVVNEGQFAIDFSPVSGSDCSHPTGPCDSCTVAAGQFSANAPTTANALYFTGTPSLCYPPKAYPGTNPAPVLSVTPYLTHSFTNSTTNALCITAELDFACPAAPTNTLGVAAYLGTFDPNNPSVGYLGDMGLGGPPYPVFSFQVPAATNFTVVVMAQTTNLPCNSYSLQLFGLPCQPPVLAIQPEPASTNHVRVNWSTAYPGFSAQQSGKLTGGNFSNVIQSPIILNSRYALTNLPAFTNQFYRLKK